MLLGGGIGSGKSLAGRRFAVCGAFVVDADELGHEVIEPGGEAYEGVGRRWPSVLTDSRIDRALLGQIVFGDHEQLRELEAMTHPAIVNRIAAIAGETHDLVVEIPLMLQIPGDWTTIYVDAHPDRRIRRAVDRGLDEANVRRRMGNQPRRWEWLAWADRILENNGTPAELAERVDTLWKELQLR